MLRAAHLCLDWRHMPQDANAAALTVCTDCGKKWVPKRIKHLLLCGSIDCAAVPVPLVAQVLPCACGHNVYPHNGALQGKSTLDTVSMLHAHVHHVRGKVCHCLRPSPACPAGARRAVSGSTLYDLGSGAQKRTCNRSSPQFDGS